MHNHSEARTRNSPNYRPRQYEGSAPGSRRTGRVAGGSPIADARSCTLTSRGWSSC